MKRSLFTSVLAVFLVFFLAVPCFADGTDKPTLSDDVIMTGPALTVTGKGCVLMEASTGQVLFESGKDTVLPPASVTKVMTLLLIMEAVDDGRITLTDTVTASEHAASMGGTQIYLQVGETMTVDELLKAVAIPSANDAAVALAEFVAGSESEFVSMMNNRAAELGMKNSKFTNCTGLFDDNEHYTTAYDIALMTRELMKHPKIFDYTTVWMDSLRDGAFGLANTNKMLRTYTGMTGMKTGYTKLAGHCLSGTAQRDGMSLIAVTLGAPTSKERFDDIAAMLDYGFATYSDIDRSAETSEPIKVIKGRNDSVQVRAAENLNLLVKKGKEKGLETEVVLEPQLTAPVYSGQKVGTVRFILDGQTVKECDVVATEDVERASFTDYFRRIMGLLF